MVAYQHGPPAAFDLSGHESIRWAWHETPSRLVAVSSCLVSLLVAARGAKWREWNNWKPVRLNVDEGTDSWLQNAPTPPAPPTPRRPQPGTGLTTLRTFTSRCIVQPKANSHHASVEDGCAGKPCCAYCVWNIVGHCAAVRSRAHNHAGHVSVVHLVLIRSTHVFRPLARPPTLTTAPPPPPCRWNNGSSFVGSPAK